MIPENTLIEETLIKFKKTEKILKRENLVYRTNESRDRLKHFWTSSSFSRDIYTIWSKQNHKTS